MISTIDKVDLTHTYWQA